MLYNYLYHQYKFEYVQLKVVLKFSETDLTLKGIPNCLPKFPQLELADLLHLILSNKNYLLTAVWVAEYFWQDSLLVPGDEIL